MRHSQNVRGKLISFTKQCVYKDPLLVSYIQIEKHTMIISMFKLKFKLVFSQKKSSKFSTYIYSANIVNEGFS